MLRKERDQRIFQRLTFYQISIHALRKERDTADNRRKRIVKFQSTRSARSATEVKTDQCNKCRISIHALRKERDCHVRAACCAFVYFNPRAPQGARRWLNNTLITTF